MPLSSRNLLNVLLYSEIKTLSAIWKALRHVGIMQFSTTLDIVFHDILMGWETILCTTLQHDIERLPAAYYAGEWLTKGVCYGKMVRFTCLIVKS